MILAIDQGSSKTTVALVSSDGRILSEATTGGACYFSVGVEKAFAEIESAVKQAVEKVGVSQGEITRVCGGIAGANWPDEIEMLTNEIHIRFNVNDISVYNDCVVALYGGTDKPNGIILCAGSAFNGAVMKDKKLKHVFNNYVDPNDQGGVALGSRALQAVFDSYIGMRDKTILTKLLLEYYGYDEVDMLLLGRDRNQLKYHKMTSVPILIEAAYLNDRVALDVIYEFSKSVARYAIGSIKKYGLVGNDCDIVLSGGVFKSEHPLFYETIATQVHCVSCQARIVNAEYEPIVGAALLGLSEAGTSPEAADTCRQSALDIGLLRKKYVKNT